MSAEWEGVKELRQVLEGYSEELKPQIVAALNRSALRIVGQAKRLAPVDTGRLMSSLAILRTTNEGLTIDVGTNVEYASYVEYGTTRQKAQPYLFPAAEAERPRLMAELQRIVSQ